jgi:hypothetical protein
VENVAKVTIVIVETNVVAYWPRSAGL